MGAATLGEARGRGGDAHGAVEGGRGLEEITETSGLDPAFCSSLLYITSASTSAAPVLCCCNVAVASAMACCLALRYAAWKSGWRSPSRRWIGSGSPRASYPAPVASKKGSPATLSRSRRFPLPRRTSHPPEGVLHPQAQPRSASRTPGGSRASCPQTCAPPSPQNILPIVSATHSTSAPSNASTLAQAVEFPGIGR